MDTISNDITQEIINRVHPGYQYRLLIVSKLFNTITIALANSRYHAYGPNKAREILIAGDLYNFMHRRERLLNIRLAYQDPELAAIKIIRREIYGKMINILGEPTAILKHKNLKYFENAFGSHGYIGITSIKYINLMEIAATGNLDIVRSYFALGGKLTLEPLVEGAYASGNQEMINWMLAMGGYRASKLPYLGISDFKSLQLKGICLGGHLALFEQFVICNKDNMPKILSNILDAAYIGGSLEIIDRLTDYPPFDAYSSRCCASGNIEIYEFMRSLVPSSAWNNYDQMLSDAIMANSPTLINIMMNELRELKKQGTSLNIHWAELQDIATEEGLLDLAEMFSRRSYGDVISSDSSD